LSARAAVGLAAAVGHGTLHGGLTRMDVFPAADGRARTAPARRPVRAGPRDGKNLARRRRERPGGSRAHSPRRRALHGLLAFPAGGLDRSLLAAAVHVKGIETYGARGCW